MATGSILSNHPDGATSSAALLDSADLENGDRLDRCEFERRYKARPDIKKAELVEGTVLMPSPVCARSHAAPSASLVGWLTVYCAFTPRVSVLDNATVRLDPDNEPQPDALLRIDADADGRSRISDDDYVEGPPELIVEVAASSAAYDLHDKLNAYRRNGVAEYVVWRSHDRAIDWFVLADGEYHRQAPSANGVLQSSTFPGLRLSVDALLAGDMAAVLAELQRGVGSQEHAEFVARLGRHASDP